MQEQANRPARTEDDDNEEDDDDDDDCGSGDDSPSGSNSEETTEKSSNSGDNNEHLYQLSTEMSNVINPVTIDEDRTMTDLFTSQPIPPPASEIEKIIESTTRRPLPPKKQGNIEIIMLPLPPSETATQKTSFMSNKNLNKENKKHLSGIQITDGGLSPNDINNLEDDLDSNFDSNLNQYGGSNRENSMSESSNEILGAIPISIINKNLIDFKFNKNSADRTALLIAAIAILIIIVVIIAPIFVFVKMRLRLSRNGKLAGVPITNAQLSPAYQVTNKSYASLAASGSMVNHALNPVSFASNPNFHTSMHHLAMNQALPPNLTITPNPIYGTIDKAAKLPNKKDLGKEWYV